jgi:hypothetical protein
MVASTEKSSTRFADMTLPNAEYVFIIKNYKPFSAVLIKAEIKSMRVSNIMKMPICRRSNMAQNCIGLMNLKKEGMNTLVHN